MNNTICLRAHFETRQQRRAREREGRKGKERAERKRKDFIWPDYALVFDTETTIDDRQSLTFGGYRLLRAKDGAYTDCREEGFFYAGKDVPRALVEFAKKYPPETSADCLKKIRIRSLESFIKEVFFKNALAGALVVGVNLVFDLSRITADAVPAKRLNQDWSLVLLKDKDPKTGKQRANPFYPRIIITRRDGRLSFVRFAGRSIRKRGEKLPFVHGRFLDLGTLGWALRNVHYGLNDMCKALNLLGKLDHEPTGRVDAEEIRYCREDVRATARALNGWRKEFDLHNPKLLKLPPDQAYSPASIAKGYLTAMGIVPPSEKFDLSPKEHGIACQAYSGARCEARIRHTILPVVHLDYRSNYPGVIILLGLWRMLISTRLRLKPATREAKWLFERMKPGDLYKKDFWKNLAGFALVKPDGHLMPVRTGYGDESTTLGINFLKAKEPLWMAFPDLAAMKCRTGKIPKIIRAVRLVGEGKQESLETIMLRGSVRIDPRKHDFFKTVIVLREQVKKSNPALAYFLKILANSLYGFFIESNPKHFRKLHKIELFSGDWHRTIHARTVEIPGKWYCPAFSSLITSAGRLLLMMLEHEVEKAGGTYLATDTDAMTIVSSKRGGLVSCQDAKFKEIIALPWGAIEDICKKSERLNPFGDKVPFLKVEKDSLTEQLFAFAVSAKRYVLFNVTSGSIRIRKASMHGLGHLFVTGPEAKFDDDIDSKQWVSEAWEFILRRVLGFRPRKTSWWNTPAMIRVRITTPKVQAYIALHKREKRVRYAFRSAKPFNFLMSPEIFNAMVNPRHIPSVEGLVLGFPEKADPAHFRLIAPFSKKSSDWYGPHYVNMYNRHPYSLVPIERKQAFDASPFRLGDIVLMHPFHPESKSLAPDASRSKDDTHGVLQRMTVAETNRVYTGKEIDPKLDDDEDIGFLSGSQLSVFLDEKKGYIKDAGLRKKCRAVSNRRNLAKRAKVSPSTLLAFINGKRIQKRTARSLLRALKQVESEKE